MAHTARLGFSQCKMSLPLLLIAGAGAIGAGVIFKKISANNAANAAQNQTAIPTDSDGLPYATDGDTSVSDNGSSIGSTPGPMPFPQDGTSQTGQPLGTDSPAPDTGTPSGSSGSTGGLAGITGELNAPTPPVAPAPKRYVIQSMATLHFGNAAQTTTQQKAIPYANGTAAALGLVW